ncbi:hypothetical protein [Pleurocapsa sp. FMAR1]|uniref:hypothetical protein n=1 Tax=Pleurocapsa sp. FMAR1 TaxID=3040204 RepID=UPI0039B09870
MPAPYSYDLRKKAVDACSRGEKKRTICRLMKISRNTLLAKIRSPKPKNNACSL